MCAIVLCACNALMPFDANPLMPFGVHSWIWYSHGGIVEVEIVEVVFTCSGSACGFGVTCYDGICSYFCS